MTGVWSCNSDHGECGLHADGEAAGQAAALPAVYGQLLRAVSAPRSVRLPAPDRRDTGSLAPFPPHARPYLLHQRRDRRHPLDSPLRGLPSQVSHYPVSRIIL